MLFRSLINFCIVPIEFSDSSDYDEIEAGDELVIENLLDAIKDGDEVRIAKADGAVEFVGKLELSARDRKILLAGGRLNFTKKRAKWKRGREKSRRTEDTEFLTG